MSYVDKYIKNLKPSDLNLSLWGGDVSLSNLELNLHALEQVSTRPVRNLVDTYTARCRFRARFLLDQGELSWELSYIKKNSIHLATKVSSDQISETTLQFYKVH